MDPMEGTSGCHKDGEEEQELLWAYRSWGESEEEPYWENRKSASLHCFKGFTQAVSQTNTFSSRTFDSSCL